jgi:hypothetical protein
MSEVTYFMFLRFAHFEANHVSLWWRLFCSQGRLHLFLPWIRRFAPTTIYTSGWWSGSGYMDPCVVATCVRQHIVWFLYLKEKRKPAFSHFNDVDGFAWQQRGSHVIGLGLVILIVLLLLTLVLCDMLWILLWYLLLVLLLTHWLLLLTGYCGWYCLLVLFVVIVI